MFSLLFCDCGARVSTRLRGRRGGRPRQDKARYPRKHHLSQRVSDNTLQGSAQGARNTTQIAVRERRKRKTCAGLESNPRPLAHAPALDAFAAARGALSTSDNTHSRTRVTWIRKEKYAEKSQKSVQKSREFCFLACQKSHGMPQKKEKKKGVIFDDSRDLMLRFFLIRTSCSHVLGSIKPSRSQTRVHQQK